MGFILGPGREDKSWAVPLQKYLDRAKLWGATGAGLCTSLRAYQVFAASTLMFVGQLGALPDKFEDQEAGLARLLFEAQEGGCLLDACAGSETLDFLSNFRISERGVQPPKHAFAGSRIVSTVVYGFRSAPLGFNRRYLQHPAGRTPRLG